ncbi:MAG: branched-chain amino acid ABC transporter permease [Anaerolineales bacterium]|nr:branched-chain amino acid ABC transporter permease [Anaerolineales bacterium]MCB8952289.1 branched-chain amino acid ABC transporter permease [Ardenticatenales bacterium]
MAVSRPAGDFDRRYEQDMAVLRQRWQYVVLFLCLVALYTLPLYGSGTVISLVNRIGIFIIAVQGLNILTGYTGQISLGQAAFMTVGGYVSALLVGNLGWSFFLALPVAGLVAGLVGLLFGLPSLRVKGFYLVMATLGAQFIIPWFARNSFKDVLNGAQGINVAIVSLKIPVIANSCLLGTTYKADANACFFSFGEPSSFLLITLTVLMITTIATHNISRSRFGRALVSVRDNDLAAELLGINLFTYKLRAFFLAAVYAGIAGALLAHNLRFINSETVNLTSSVLMLGMLVVGGLGTSVGPFFGVTLVLLIEEAVVIITPILIDLIPAIEGTATAALRPLIFGLALMLFLVFEPRGLAYRWQLIKAAWRLRPFAH